MNWASITILIFAFLNVLIAANEHGTVQERERHFFVDVVNTIMWLVLVYFSGGFL